MPGNTFVTGLPIAALLASSPCAERHGSRPHDEVGPAVDGLVHRDAAAHVVEELAVASLARKRSIQALDSRVGRRRTRLMSSKSHFTLTHRPPPNDPRQFGDRLARLPATSMFPIPSILKGRKGRHGSLAARPRAAGDRAC